MVLKVSDKKPNNAAYAVMSLHTHIFLGWDADGICRQKKTDAF